MILRVSRVFVAFFLFACFSHAAEAQNTVTVTIPSWVSFSIFDVASATTGSPNPTRVSFSDASLASGSSLVISVRAEAASFTPPSGIGIPASNVSWSPTAWTGGGAAANTLTTDYRQVFLGHLDVTSGWVDLKWTLATPGPDIGSGTHQLTLRWKVESNSLIIW